MAARPTKLVCGRSLAGIVISNPTGGMDVCLLWVFCIVFASGWSLIQRSPTECGVSECDSEASIMRRPWPTRGLMCNRKKENRLKCFRTKIPKSCETEIRFGDMSCHHIRSLTVRHSVKRLSLICQFNKKNYNLCGAHSARSLPTICLICWPRTFRNLDSKILIN